MKAKIASRKSTSRLKTGATILMNAQAVNTKPVKVRLNAFAEAHRKYCEAQVKVEEAESVLATQQTLIDQLDVKQDDTVHALAVNLVNNGQPFTNAFTGFSNLAPGAIKELPPAQEVSAIRDLVQAVRRSKSVTQDTLEAAQAAEQAAENVEAALPSLNTAGEMLRMQRALRDTYARSWDAELASLRLAARSEEREAPGLSAALFGHLGRAAKKNGTTKAAKQPPAAAVAETAPAETTNPAAAPVA